MDQALLKELRNKLNEEHSILVAELKSIATKDPHIKGDWNADPPKFETEEGGSHSSLEEEADEVEEYETRLAAEHSLESRLLEVNKALERIENGTYGTCTGCKKEISVERLRANPAASAHTEHA